MKESISVAMATYNGQKYIKEQILSILPQLGESDEIIISDDGSTDSTKDIIRFINDKRIKIIDGPRKGVKQNFANAITNCKNNIIFLCDQDDVWVSNKVEGVLKAFDKYNCTCVVHDCVVANEQMDNIIYDSFFSLKKCKSGILKNITRNSYIGCCMAFRSELKKYILPIPNSIEMHDQWIGIISEIKGKSVFINDKLLKYRRHNQNVSSLKHYDLLRMIKNRILLTFNLIWSCFK